MRRIAIMNQKGGVGKTTTTVNLAAALAKAGKAVCVVDLDPQAHATEHFGVRGIDDQQTIYDGLLGGTALARLIHVVRDNLSLVPSDINLAAAEVEMAGIAGRESRLRDLLDQHVASFDFVLMDCPPSLGVLTLNALAAASEVFVPLQPHYLALHGMSKLFETIELVARRLNPALVVSGIIVCLYETGTRLSAEVVNDLEEFLEKARVRGLAAPWSDAVIFHTRIRRNVRLAEASSHGESIFEYDTSSAGARDYAALAREVLTQRVAHAPGASLKAS
jgi:chromosome partitioning protein